jgi:hypothetical protein
MKEAGECTKRICYGKLVKQDYCSQRTKRLLGRNSSGG